MSNAFEDDDDRRAFFDEEFDTGHAAHMPGLFDIQWERGDTGDFQVPGPSPRIECLTADVKARGLVKGSVIRRLRDGSTYRIKSIEHDGFGMTTLVLSQ